MKEQREGRQAGREVGIEIFKFVRCMRRKGFWFVMSVFIPRKEEWVKFLWYREELVIQSPLILVGAKKKVLIWVAL